MGKVLVIKNLKEEEQGTFGVKIANSLCTAKLQIEGADAYKLDGDVIIPETATQQLSTKTKTKKEKTLPKQAHEEIKPKLKKIRNEETTESPLDKLKRLGNAKPVEYEESVSEEVVISELPSYDLPTKRQKTALENYEFKERDKDPKDPKVEECKKEHPEKWEKITKKTNLSGDTTSSMVLGKGKISDTGIEDELKLKRLQRDKPEDLEQSVTLKPFNTNESQDNIEAKPSED